LRFVLAQGTSSGDLEKTMAHKKKLSKTKLVADTSLTLMISHYTMIKTVFMYFCV